MTVSAPTVKSRRSRRAESPIGPGRWLIVVLLTAAPVLAFARACGQEFTHWDDNWMIHENPRLNPPTLGSIGWYWTHQHGGMYAPMPYTMWVATAFACYQPEPDALGFHLNPWLFHGLNLIFHIGTTFIVFNILRLLVGQEWPATLGALLYSIHPLQVEPVAWAVSLKEVLCGFFGFLCLWQFVLYTREAQQANPFTSRRWWLAVVALAAALLSNPLAAAMPFICGVVDLLLLRRKLRSVVVATGPMLILAILVGVLAKLNQPDFTRVVPSIPMRIPLALDALAFYLWKLVLPIHLVADYGRRPEVVVRHGWYLWTWIFPVVAGLLLAWAGRRRPWAAAAGLIFVCGVLPVLGLVPFEFQKYSTVTDRYACLALFGPALAISFAFATLQARFRAVAYAVAGSILGLFVGICIYQVGFWKNDGVLWQHTISHAPDSYLAHQNFASVFWKAGPAFDPTAETEFRKAIAIRPDFRDAYDGLALVLLREKRTREAIPVIQKSLDLLEAWGWKPKADSAQPYFDLGRLCLQQGFYEQARRNLSRAVSLDPSYPHAAELLRRAQSVPTTGSANP